MTQVAEPRDAAFLGEHDHVDQTVAVEVRGNRLGLRQIAGEHHECAKGAIAKIRAPSHNGALLGA